MSEQTEAPPIPGQITVEEMIREMELESMVDLMVEPPGPLYRTKPGRCPSGLRNDDGTPDRS